MALADLDVAEQALGLAGEMICLDPDGKPTAYDVARGPAPEPVADPDVARRGLVAVRRGR